MAKPKENEREKWLNKNSKELSKVSKDAGDESISEGQTSEERKAYPKLLRSELVFDPDFVGEQDDAEIILNAGCRSINDNF